MATIDAFDAAGSFENDKQAGSGRSSSHDRPSPIGLGPRSAILAPPKRKKKRSDSKSLRRAADESDTGLASEALLAPEHGEDLPGEDGYDHKNPWARGKDWPIVIWIAFVHIGALGALYFISWQGILTFALLSWVTGSLGVCMGYHRLLTHGSFQTYRPIRWFFAWLGGMSGEGSAITWVGNHRKHHAHSDKDGDPHSPRDGGLWSHMLWFMPNHGAKWHADLTARYAPDLAKDPMMVFLHKTFLVWHWVFGVALFFAGQALWGTDVAWSLVFWGVFLRTVFVLHVTWFVNSATHLWGYKNYETSDDSTNLWWVGLLAFGEGWHNNHHAYQRMAKHGHKWWEVDITYWAICALEKVGLAWNVVRKIPKNEKPA